MEILVTLIEVYENKHYSISPPHPIEAIKFRMEQQNLVAKDLEAFIGSSGRVSEILNIDIPLSLKEEDSFLNKEEKNFTIFQVSTSMFIAQGNKLGCRVKIPCGNFYDDESTHVSQVSCELHRLKIPHALRYV